jgi:hypothetical protein
MNNKKKFMIYILFAIILTIIIASALFFLHKFNGVNDSVSAQSVKYELNDFISTGKKAEIELTEEELSSRYKVQAPKKSVVDISDGSSLNIKRSYCDYSFKFTSFGSDSIKVLGVKNFDLIMAAEPEDSKNKPVVDEFDLNVGRQFCVLSPTKNTQMRWCVKLLGFKD